jgi:hypothetical protein
MPILWYCIGARQLASVHVFDFFGVAAHFFLHLHLNSESHNVFWFR